MRKRPISIIILVVAFLLSAWGNVIAAAFCPRYLSNGNSETKQQPWPAEQINQKSSCHHEMAGMEMGHMSMGETELKSEDNVETSDNAIPEGRQIRVRTEATTEEAFIDFPPETCGHCWMHSQPPAGTTTLVAVDPSKQVIDTSAPRADSAVTLPCALTVSATPLEHGPPGNVLPRHVLINVFRI